MNLPSRDKLSTGEYLDAVNDFVSKSAPVIEEAPEGEIPKEIESDFESLLTFGFIKLKTTCFGVPIIWKTLTPKEVDLLRDITWGVVEEDFQHFLSYHLATSIYTVNGINILPFRDKIMHNLSNFFLQTPYIFLRSLSSVLIHLGSRLRRVQAHLDDLIESPVSQGLWEIYKRDKKSFFSGAEGAQNLGLSIPKAHWLTAMGLRELKEKMDRSYDLATYIGAFANPKAAKAIFSQKAAREEAKKQEKELQERLAGQEPLTRPIKTKQDLVHQLENSVKGVQDKHDEIVKKYELETWQKMMDERNRLIAKNRRSSLPSITIEQKIVDLATVQREMRLRTQQRFKKS